MKKKKSIRLFVSEEELKFHLNLLKYSQLLKNISDKPQKDIINLHKTEVQKRLGLLDKERVRTDENNTVAMDALRLNEEYVNRWVPLLDIDGIHDVFEEKRNRFIDYLINKINTENLEKDKQTLEFVKNVKLVKNNSKEKFGEILLLIIKNMATMPSFASYTENWKTDFYSNAIEKTLLYAHNFDEDLISKRTGEKSKAFAYITQICFNAFVSVINTRKAESEFLKHTISYETSKIDSLRKVQLNGSRLVNNKFNNSKVIELFKTDDINTVIIDNIKKAILSNEIINNNRLLIDEIKYLENITKIKDDNFINYINDMVSEIKENIYGNIIDVIIFEKVDDIVIPIDFNIPQTNIEIQIISPKTQALIEEEIDEDETFFSEWEIDE